MAAKRAKMPEEEKRYRKLTNTTRVPTAEGDNCAQIRNIPPYIRMYSCYVQWVCRLYASVNALKSAECLQLLTRVLNRTTPCVHASVAVQHAIPY